ncbi:precorrin-6y C5,15-methyltransferase (decarboxylating) subunit CbiE [Wenjunlia tyrosinilytica]|uniref:Precorrin-6y C5,15-methyltransferase (Decarboxylating) subunit CbiE n=1 Tax=Wenjunlia tyrosinilytica TaxID=1544741 RepID=A0A918DSX2_9ACTN|nr:precorrin-6y C5,15-methyltransferase (decarboxylating) subunit CbiE [Wenjunlia tyrosinilytica]GGO82602.1 precorrin-6y C5,15-methyltransferase (decarboxylating) subunit CbiE [Wenjunlia tyrosinilytica]
MADRVTVIGWDGSPLSAAARSALGAATMVAGARHHLTLPEIPRAAQQVLIGSVPLAARRIADHRGTAVVLGDGDPGFFGIVRVLRRSEYGLEVEVVPAASSVAQAFARAGMPWDDAKVVVAHERSLRRAVNVCRAHHKVAVLTAPGAGPAELALLLGDVHRTFVICEFLGTEREEVSVLTSDKVADHTWRDPNVVLVVGGSGAFDATGWIAGQSADFPGAVRGWARHDEHYGEPDGLGSLERAFVLAKLGPRTGDLVWDVGAGSGAVAVEAAGFGAAVIAVDGSALACERIEANARRHSVQVQVVHGQAPAALEDLPEPDVVRVGAGGARVVAACASRKPERIVTLVATRAQAQEVREALESAGYAVETELLRSARLLPTGDQGVWADAFAVCGDRG